MDRRRGRAVTYGDGRAVHRGPRKAVSDAVSGVTVAAIETGEVAGHVLAAARDLSQHSERLRREVGAFLAKVRAA
jgi:hypothetical protein